MKQNNKLLWLFSGTSDGNEIAQCLVSQKCRLKVFVATQYGRKVAAESLPPQIVEAGRLNENEMGARADLEPPSQVIDATHPYALEISKNLMHFCDTRKIPYIRYERPEEQISGENIYFVDNIEQAAEKTRTLGKQILLTLGSKNIEPFLGEDFCGRIFIRMLPDPQLIDHLLSKGVSPDRIIAIQGPFSISMNLAMMGNYAIDCLVTKSSGKEGGFPQKIAAAKELGASVIIIKRPDMSYPISFSKKNEVIKYLNISR
ncbi:MAG TPA: precorrin-6A reductase [Nitrospinaceae bacterium]|nr:precorrin-6A reductase [Nitrospinaceae bacterium]